MKKMSSYKGFVIGQKDGQFYVFTNEEWSYGSGFRYAEIETGSIREAKDFIDSY